MSVPFYVSPEQLMRDRADFARKGIAKGRSAIALQYADGILFVAENRSPALHKVAEIYDRMAFAAVGRYNEFENLRIAGVRLADMRGYSYDRRDVTGRALANAYAQTLGAIFSSGGEKPLEVEILVADLDHEDLDLERLHLVGEDVAEHLGVLVGERVGLHVLAAVAVALEVGVADPRDAELVELVVLAHPGEGDAVVDLADLVERRARVLGRDEDAVGEQDRGGAATACDALAGVVGPVLHHLLGRDVERHAHGRAPPCSAALVGSAPPIGPCAATRSMSALVRSASSSSPTRW